MKKIFLSFFCLALMQLIIGQTPFIYKIPNELFKKDKDLTENFTESKKYTIGIFKAENAVGKLYVLPLDNMICLVPKEELSVKIPNKITLLKEQGIPNSLSPGKK